MYRQTRAGVRQANRSVSLLWAVHNAPCLADIGTVIQSPLAVAVTFFVTLQPALAAEKECPKGDVAKSGTLEAYI